MYYVVVQGGIMNQKIYVDEIRTGGREGVWQIRTGLDRGEGGGVKNDQKSRTSFLNRPLQDYKITRYHLASSYRIPAILLPTCSI